MKPNKLVFLLTPEPPPMNTQATTTWLALSIAMGVLQHVGATSFADLSPTHDLVLTQQQHHLLTQHQELVNTIVVGDKQKCVPTVCATCGVTLFVRTEPTIRNCQLSDCDGTMLAPQPANRMLGTHKTVPITPGVCELSGL